MNIDLGPTFIALAGGQVPPYMDGKSLIPVWHADANRTRGGFRSELLVEHYGEHKPSIEGCPQYKNEGMGVSIFKYYQGSPLRTLVRILRTKSWK